jgi:uncharacterized SAM-binding protein YcdF (DUF218 family)
VTSDLSYFISKAIWFVVRPGNLLLLILLIATLVAWLRPGKGWSGGRLWLTLVSALLLFVTFAPVNSWIARPLEERFPVPAALPAHIDGILVLGGIAQRPISDQRQTLAVNESAERLMVSAALALRYPGARLVISGSGEDQQSLKAWFSHIGLESERVQFETASRNTFENAVLSRHKIQPGLGQVWLLVTSAQHMPRAMGVFRKLGWPVLPYPVDFRTAGPDNLVGWPDMAENLAGVSIVLKEWVGLLAYYLLDRTDELWPAPESP